MSVAVCSLFSVDPAYGRRNILRLGCISDVSAIRSFYLKREVIVFLKIYKIYLKFFRLCILRNVNNQNFFDALVPAL